MVWVWGQENRVQFYTYEQALVRSSHGLRQKKKMAAKDAAPTVAPVLCQAYEVPGSRA